MHITSFVSRYLMGPTARANHLSPQSGRATARRQSAVLSTSELRALILDMVG